MSSPKSAGCALHVVFFFLFAHCMCVCVCCVCAAASLRISVKDGVGSTLYAGCQDIAYIQVEVVDSAGAVVPTSSDVVTFTVSGVGTLAGTSNGDPASTINNKVCFVFIPPTIVVHYSSHRCRLCECMSL